MENTYPMSDAQGMKQDSYNFSIENPGDITALYDISLESIDTTKTGIYYVYYKISDSSRNEGVVIRSVNIYKKDTIPPTIELNEDNIVNINLGESYEELGATATDEGEDSGDITYKSSDDSIATVDSTGLVTLKKAGNVEIDLMINNVVVITKKLLCDNNKRRKSSNN